MLRMPPSSRPPRRLYPSLRAQSLSTCLARLSSLDSRAAAAAAAAAAAVGVVDVGFPQRLKKLPPPKLKPRTSPRRMLPWYPDPPPPRHLQPPTHHLARFPARRPSRRPTFLTKRSVSVSCPHSRGLLPGCARTPSGAGMRSMHCAQVRSLDSIQASPAFYAPTRQSLPVSSYARPPTRNSTPRACCPTSPSPTAPPRGPRPSPPKGKPPKRPWLWKPPKRPWLWKPPKRPWLCPYRRHRQCHQYHQTAPLPRRPPRRYESACPQRRPPQRLLRHHDQCHQCHQC